MHRVFLLLIALSFVPSTALAQNWAEKMFDATSHDFGTVARGAQTRHVFTVTNIYKETVHVAGIAKSCGCTSAAFDRDTLKTYEQALLTVEMDTLKFTEQKSSTLTITFDQPFYAEVKVPVSAYIRRDVVLSPGGAAFGSVAQGDAPTREIEVKYAGRSDWRIETVRSTSKYVEATFAESRRDSGRVAYRLVLQMKPDAPAGYFHDQLTLVTNDTATRELPLVAEGRVEPEVTVSPQTLSFGVVRPGQTVTRQIVVRGKRPFAILGIKAHDDAEATPFAIKVPDEKKALYLIPITFTAPDKPGTITEEFRIETDLPNVPALEFSTHSQVAP
jgi:hypothetical protein